MTGGTVAVVLIPVKRRLDRFMNRILPVTVLAEAPTNTVTILFSDIVGYTRLTGDDQKTALTMMSVFHKAADRALGWIERAQLTGDRLVALLFLFFALEAILGDESEGSKAMPLAFRQALLDVDRSGGFSDPNPTWLLYGAVRSAAVHGSEAPPISERTLSTFA